MLDVSIVVTLLLGILIVAFGTLLGALAMWIGQNEKAVSSPSRSESTMVESPFRRAA